MKLEPRRSERTASRRRAASPRPLSSATAGQWAGFGSSPPEERELELERLEGGESDGVLVRADLAPEPTFGVVGVDLGGFSIDASGSMIGTELDRLRVRGGQAFVDGHMAKAGAAVDDIGVNGDNPNARRPSRPSRASRPTSSDERNGGPLKNPRVSVCV